MLVKFENVSKVYNSRFFSNKKTVAVENINFSIYENETLGIIGNSGCGKTTISKLLTGLIELSGGNIFYKGEPMFFGDKKFNKVFSKEIQIVFQHPENSLNPNMTIMQNLLEPIKIHKHFSKEEAFKKIKKNLELTKLSEELLNRYPKTISGGEAQRVMICKALLMEPSLIVLDEPTSMLDVITQGEIIRLLKELKEKEKLSYLFVTHDLELARFFCDRLIIMEKGKILEQGKTEEIFRNPKNEFTNRLIKSFEELTID